MDSGGFSYSEGGANRPPSPLLAVCRRPHESRPVRPHGLLGRNFGSFLNFNRQLMNRLNTVSNECGRRQLSKRTMHVFKISKEKNCSQNRPTHWRKRHRSDERILCSYLGRMITTDTKCHRDIKRRTVI